MKVASKKIKKSELPFLPVVPSPKKFGTFTFPSKSKLPENQFKSEAVVSEMRTKLKNILYKDPLVS